MFKCLLKKCLNVFFIKISAQASSQASSNLNINVAPPHKAMEAIKQNKTKHKWFLCIAVLALLWHCVRKSLWNSSFDSLNFITPSMRIRAFTKAAVSLTQMFHWHSFILACSRIDWHLLYPTHGPTHYQPSNNGTLKRSDTQQHSFENGNESLH